MNKNMEEEPEYEYYVVEVEKKSYSEIYIKVPKGEEITWRDKKLISEATVETLDEGDWDDYGWADDLETNSIRKTTRETAKFYEVYDATEYFPVRPKPEDPNQMKLDF
jgi:hypothetical protein